MIKEENKTIKNYSKTQMKELKSIRVTNLIIMNLFILLVLPRFAHQLGWKNDIWSIAILGIYLFLFFGFWFFIYFMYCEINYVIKLRINFLKHVLSNKLVLWGIIPFVIYLILFILSSI